MGSYQTTKALGRYLAFPPKLARAIGIEETIFLLNFLYSASEGEEWVERTSAQLEEETTLTYKQQTRIREKLEGLGLIEVRTNRREHQTFYRVVEEKYDELILSLKTAKREFDELTFGSNSTLPKVNSPNLPKGSSLKEKEEVQEERQEAPPTSVSKFEEEMEERRNRRLEKKQNKGRGFKRTTMPPRSAPVRAPKPPETWDWFASLWHRYTDVFPLSRPEHWNALDELQLRFGRTNVEERLSRWLDQRGGKITAWAAVDFLRECALMNDEDEDDGIPEIVNER